MSPSVTVAVVDALYNATQSGWRWFRAATAIFIVSGVVAVPFGVTVFALGAVIAAILWMHAAQVFLTGIADAAGLIAAHIGVP